jgi:hypothetical protein
MRIDFAKINVLWVSTQKWVEWELQEAHSKRLRHKLLLVDLKPTQRSASIDRWNALIKIDANSGQLLAKAYRLNTTPVALFWEKPEVPRLIVCRNPRRYDVELALCIALAAITRAEPSIRRDTSE